MKMIYQTSSVYWQEFVRWFFSLPLFGQILVGIGIATIIVLVLIGVYYLLKGIAYLIYYTLKGVYYIIKGLAIGIYKFFNWLYRLIVGKSDSEEKETEENQSLVAQPQPIPIVQNSYEQSESDLIKYCPECGVEFTNSMSYQLNKDGFVYCSFCGKKLDMTNSISVVI
jgi:hypothetical protein